MTGPETPGSQECPRPTTCYRQRGDVVARRIAGEYILVPVRGSVADLGRIFALNPVGETVWDALTNERSFDDLSAAIMDRFEVDLATARRDLAEFLAEMESAGLVIRRDEDRASGR